MKRLLTGLALLVCSLGAAAQHCIPSGTTDQYTYFVAVDATDLVTRETGLTSFTVYRSRNGGPAAAFDSPTVNEVDATHMPGVYELLLDEDMTIGAGNDVEHMVLHISHAGMAPVTKEICIARAKLTEGETLTVSSGVASANATQWGGTAVASATVNANVAQISGDSGAADALEAAFDGTAGAVAPLGIARQGTAQSATETTLVLDAGASFADDAPIGMTLVACGSTQGYCQSRVVTDYTGSTDTATVEAWEVTPSGTITYYLFATAGANLINIPWNSAWDAEVQDALLNTTVEGVTLADYFCRYAAVLYGQANYDTSEDETAFSDPDGGSVRVTVAYGTDAGDRSAVTFGTSCGP